MDQNPNKIMIQFYYLKRLRVSDDGEVFADRVKKVHEEVKEAIKCRHKPHATATNQHQRVKGFKGDMALVNLWWGKFPKGTYHKLKSNNFGPCKVLKMISLNAYVVEFLAEL